MKFLIFNLMVLSCLGYLIMGKPNENFIQWASKTKEKVSNLSREDFLEKVNNAVKSNNHESKAVAKDNINFEAKYREQLMKMIKKELLKFDKKLEIALQKLPTRDYTSINNNALEAVNKPTKSQVIQEITDNDKDLYNKKIFMSNSDRSNALAELITDMELNSFND